MVKREYQSVFATKFIRNKPQCSKVRNETERRDEGLLIRVPYISQKKYNGKYRITSTDEKT